MDKFDDVIDYLPDAILIVDSTGKIIKLNSQVENMFGYHPNELIGQKIEVLLPEKFKHPHVNLRTKYQSDPHKRPMNLCTGLMAKKKDGQIANVDIMLSPIKKNGDQFVIAVVRDVTKYFHIESELRESEKKLQDKINELSTFFYKTSHNLKGPIASALGLIDLVENNKDNINPKEYYGLITESLQKLDNVISDLSELSKIEEGLLEISNVRVDDIVKEVILNLKFMEGYDNISVKISNQFKKAFATDPDLIISILQNLVENAIKYRKRGISDPELKIGISELKGKNKIKIEVSDNGIGIPKNSAQDVFNIFFRATEISKGSGLGLFIVKQAVDKLSGKVFMESEYKIGTTVTVILPTVYSDIS